MSQPIEPGCLALVVPARKYGHPRHVVTVVSKDDACKEICSTCRTNLKWWDIESPYEHSPNGLVSCECALMRIDGGDPDAILEVDKELAV